MEAPQFSQTPVSHMPLTMLSVDASSRMGVFFVAMTRFLGYLAAASANALLDMTRCQNQFSWSCQMKWPP